VIHILYGADSYRVRAAYRAIRAALSDGDDMLESNTTVLEGGTVSAQELLAHASAVPFLASHRLVVVEGLLGRLAPEQKARRGGATRAKKKKAPADDPLASWRAVAEQIGDAAALPASTTLVFIEGALSATNAALKLFSAAAQVQRFDPLKKDDLTGWIAQRAKEKGLRLTPRAVAQLATGSGGQEAEEAGARLWAVDSDLDKLLTYAGEGEVGDEMVARVVTMEQGAKWWDLTDAVAAGDERKALTSLGRLLRDGEPPPVLLSMIARQYRQLVQVKDMRERRVREAEIVAATGVADWKMKQVAPLAQRYSWDTLREAYGLLVEADLNVKRGLQDDESSLQLLVHGLCALGPTRTGAAAGAYRRSTARSG
jgi:DNA polymerase-3 subunit delta